MAMHPHRPPARHWRWLAAGVLMVVLLAAYWAVLQRIGDRLGDDVEDALRPSPMLDEHTPRVD